MQSMQDKHFDTLFRQKFEAFETEPPETAWAAIQAQLNGKKQRSSYFWIGAASLLLCLSAGFWLLKPKSTIRLQGETERISPKVEDVYVRQPANKEVRKTDGSKTELFTERRVSSYRLEKEATTQIAVEANKPVELRPVAEKQAGGDLLGQEVEPEAVALAKNDMESSQPLMEKVNEEAGITDITEEATAKAAAPRFSVAGVINFVVGKVDKREDKVVEFQETEDGAVLTGLNLGFVKIKKR